MMLHGSEDLMRMRRIARMSRDLQFKVYSSRPSAVCFSGRRLGNVFATLKVFDQGG